MNQPISKQIQSVIDAAQPVFRFATRTLYTKTFNKPGMINFAVGNPHEMPIKGFSEALARWSVPQNKEWFAYKMNEPHARKVVVDSLRSWRGSEFEPNDIFMTTGAFAGIAITLAAVVDAGDEVIFNSPPWFFYESLVLAQRATPVRVKVNERTFDLDLGAIARLITPRTRAILLNSPNNPTGKIYPSETLSALATILEEYSTQNGRRIYLISDEAYSRVIYDGRVFPSPTHFYPYSFLVYTYGKQLLAPGQRVGYIALPPTMPCATRAALRPALFAAQLVTGYAFPTALLQHALGDLENLSIDVGHLQFKRDWLVRELSAMGYELHSPEGAFYLLPRSPLEDDWRFAELLAEQAILVLPGSVVEMHGFFRISLTASDAMIDRALPGFADALQNASAMKG